MADFAVLLARDGVIEINQKDGSQKYCHQMVLDSFTPRLKAACLTISGLVKSVMADQDQELYSRKKSKRMEALACF